MSKSYFRVKLKEREFWQDLHLSGVLEFGKLEIGDGKPKIKKREFWVKKSISEVIEISETWHWLDQDLSLTIALVRLECSAQGQNSIDNVG